ncbi:MAG: riboflavin biosynthesis protein RibF [Muribaculaceae bacterium]|nr:riboflavin biosynthesis protein RibF [Muribaculaceae bacterium]
MIFPTSSMKGCVAAIGTFDGVHRGHRSVLEAIVSMAKENDLEPVAITFDRHPLSLIAPDRCPSALTPLNKKKKLISEAGAHPVVLSFDDPLRNTTAAQWMKRLAEDFNVKTLIIGYDNTFGCDGVNLSLEDYRRIGKENGIEVLTAPEIKGVSSSAIRKSVKAGELEKAHEMLGRPYSITSKVEKGNSLGHTIGFPTANIEIPEGIAIPKPGVYIAIVKILSDGSKHKAMVNIGSRPTVMRGDHTVIEAHILDWDGNLYGQEITVRFLKRIRDEKKFESIDALKHQLAQDRDTVKNYF